MTPIFSSTWPRTPRKHGGAAEKTAEAEWAGYSVISRLEVLGYPNLSAEDETKFQEILDEYNEVSVTGEIISQAIDIRKSKKMKTPDAIIAATALNCKATLVTRNTRDFTGIDDLSAHNPFEEIDISQSEKQSQ